MGEGEGFLARFEDGPLASLAGIRNLAGTPGDFELGRDRFDWPLPDRLAAIPEVFWADTKGIAIWDEADPARSHVPETFPTHPDRVIYVKVSESELAEDVPGVMRGAQYKLEEPR